MKPQSSHDRIMDGAAVGPGQFTIDQQTYIDAMPHVGRTDPVPTDFHLSRVTYVPETGSAYYDDLLPCGSDGWADPGNWSPSTWAAGKP